MAINKISNFILTFFNFFFNASAIHSLSSNKLLHFTYQWIHPYVEWEILHLSSSLHLLFYECKTHLCTLITHNKCFILSLSIFFLILIFLNAFCNKKYSFISFRHETAGNLLIFISAFLWPSISYASYSLSLTLVLITSLVFLAAVKILFQAHSWLSFINILYFSSIYVCDG